jgi:hypothetical protein
LPLELCASPFCFSLLCFSWVLHFFLPALASNSDPPTSTSQVAGTTDVGHQAQFIISVFKQFFSFKYIAKVSGRIYSEMFRILLLGGEIMSVPVFLFLIIHISNLSL